MNNFSMPSSEKSRHEQIFHVKIFCKAKFEILFPNDMIKLEIIKGIVILCLLNHFFTNINKNLKDLQKNTFQYVIIHSDTSWHPLNWTSKDTTEVEMLINCCQIRRVQTQRRYIYTGGYNTKKNKLHCFPAKRGSVEQMQNRSIKKGPRIHLPLIKKK